MGISCVAVAVTFCLMDTRESSAGLLGAEDNGGINALLAPYYAAAGRTYPAFVSLILMPPLLAIARSKLPRLVRAGALLMLVGGLSTAASIPACFAPEDWALARHAVNYGAVLGFVLGFAVIWFSGLVPNQSGNGNATLRKNDT